MSELVFHPDLFIAGESKRFMKVAFAYDPANSDELKLDVDTIVEVIKDVSLFCLDCFYLLVLFFSFKCRSVMIV